MKNQKWDFSCISALELFYSLEFFKILTNSFQLWLEECLRSYDNDDLSGDWLLKKLAKISARACVELSKSQIIS